MKAPTRQARVTFRPESDPEDRELLVHEIGRAVADIANGGEYGHALLGFEIDNAETVEEVEVE